jgi:hypothetical protein
MDRGGDGEKKRKGKRKREKRRKKYLTSGPHSG